MAQGLTLQQLQGMGATPVAPSPNALPQQPQNGTTAVASQGQGLTLAQLQGMGATPVTAPTTPNPIQQGAGAFKGLVDSSVQGITSSWQDAYDNASQQFKQAFNGKVSTPMQALASGTHLAGDLSEAIAAPFGAVFNILTGGGLNKGVNAAGNAIANMNYTDGSGKTQPLAPVLNKLNDYFDANPDVKRAVFNDIPNILNLVTMGAGGEKVASGEIPPPENPFKGGGDVPPEGGTPEKATTAPSPRDIIGNQFRKTVEQYTAPSNILSKSESMGADPIGVLQSFGNDIIPKLEEGKITANSLEEPKAIIESAINRLGEYKSDAVFQSNETVPFDQFKQMALDYADTKGSVDETAPIKEDINKIFDQMKNSYAGSKRLSPEGDLPLSEVDQIKTHQAALSRNYKPNVKTFNPDAHYFVSKAGRTLVESLTGDDANVKAFNKLMESHYDAIKVLDSLKGKTPHGGKFTKAMDTIGGTVVGGMAGIAAGHPWLGAMIGRAGAHVIDSILHNNFIPNPLKRMMIQDLGSSGDPAVVKGMIDYINENAPDIKELGEKPNQSQPKSLPISKASKTAGIKTKTGIKK